MKHLKFLSLSLVSVLFVTACNSGGGGSSAPAYTFNSFSQTIVPTNCTTNNICQASSSSLTLTSSYSSTPNSYLVIPTAPAGITITTSGVCSTTPVALYDCTVTMTASGAASGTTVTLLMNGSLGAQNFYSVTFQ